MCCFQVPDAKFLVIICAKHYFLENLMNTAEREGGKKTEK